MQALQESASDPNLSLKPISNNTDRLLFDALPFPCVIFDSFFKFILCNTAFDKEFSTNDIAVDQKLFSLTFLLVSSKKIIPNYFTRSFLPDHFGPDTPCQQKVYCHDTGKYYLFRWSQLGHSKSSKILLAIDKFTDESPNQVAAMDSNCLPDNELNTILTHELNQPLGAITNCLNTINQILDDQDSTSNRLKDSVQLAQLQAKQASQIISEFRQFHTISKQTKNLCTLNTLISDVLNRLQTEIQTHHIEIKLDIDSQLPLLMLNQVMIQQVLVNLINNAIDAMKKSLKTDRFLMIQAKTLFPHREQKTVQVKIIDKGCGISEEHRRQLFKTSYSTKKNGMGVGLRLCRSWVQCHNGEIYFEHNPGGGSIFTFTLQSSIEPDNFTKNQVHKFN